MFLTRQNLSLTLQKKPRLSILLAIRDIINIKFITLNNKQFIYSTILFLIKA